MNRAKPQKEHIVPIVGTEKRAKSVPTIFIFLLKGGNLERPETGLWAIALCTPVSGTLHLDLDNLFVACSSGNKERTSHANVVT
jgi:hypothetical protein